MEKGDPSGFIDIHSVAKYKIEVGPFGAIKKFPKKVSEQKIIEKSVKAENNLRK